MTLTAYSELNGRKIFERTLYFVTNFLINWSFISSQADTLDRNIPPFFVFFLRQEQRGKKSWIKTTILSKVIRKLNDICM